MQKIFGLCETENGTQIDELLQTGASGHLEDGRVLAKDAKTWKIEGQKKENNEK